MKTIKTYSDAGGIAIGTREAWYILPNGYGDGVTTTLVFDSWEEFEESGGSGWRFLTTIEGTRIEVVDYDCPSKRPWFDGTVHDWTPVATLSGRYGAYNDGEGRIALIRYDDAREV